VNVVGYGWFNGNIDGYADSHRWMCGRIEKKCLTVELRDKGQLECRRFLCAVDRGFGHVELKVKDD